MTLPCAIDFIYTLLVGLVMGVLVGLLIGLYWTEPDPDDDYHEDDGE